MGDLKKALPHLIMATVVIAAVLVLAIDKLVGGGDALAVIVGAGGFTLGGTVASGSISTAASAASAISPSVSIAPTATETTPPSTPPPAA